jgi:hypothetical protein
MKSLIDYMKGCYITEMADTLSKFKQKFITLKYEIIIHWCFIRWAEEYSEHPKAINRNHWASKLNAFMSDVVKTKLKSGHKEKIL